LVGLKLSNIIKNYQIAISFEFRMTLNAFVQLNYEMGKKEEIEKNKRLQQNFPATTHLLTYL